MYRGNRSTKGSIVSGAFKPYSTGLLCPNDLALYTLVFAASNMALSVAILTRKYVVSDEPRYLATTLILQGLQTPLPDALSYKRPKEILRRTP